MEGDQRTQGPARRAKSRPSTKPLEGVTVVPVESGAMMATPVSHGDVRSGRASSSMERQREPWMDPLRFESLVYDTESLTIDSSSTTLSGTTSTEDSSLALIPSPSSPPPATPDSAMELKDAASHPRAGTGSQDEARGAQQPAAATGFHDLPNYVLARIFMYFPEREIASCLSLVCRGWRAAAKQPCLWRRLDFQGKRVATSVICRLLRTATQLRELRLEAVPNAATIVRQLCRCNPEVQRVTIRNCTFRKDELIPETVFRNMVVCCPRIEELDLKGTQFSAFRFYQELIHLSRLRSVNLGANRYLKVQDLMTLALNCKGLQELRVARRPPRQGFPALSDADAVYMFTHLKGSLLSLKFDVAGLGDATLLAVMKCTHLRNLGLLNARDFSGERLRLLEENLRKLVVLKLSHACCAQTHHFRYLFSGAQCSLRNLAKLSLVACWGLEDAGLRAVVDTCKQSLQSLSLKCCKTLSAEGLRYVVLHCTMLRRFNAAFATQDAAGTKPTDTSWLDDVPQQCCHLLEKLVVDATYRRGRVLTSLHERAPSLVVALAHSEFSNVEVTLSF